MSNPGDPMPVPSRPAAPAVVAVVVTRDPGPWLEQAVDALAAQVDVRAGESVELEVDTDFEHGVLVDSGDLTLVVDGHRQPVAPTELAHLPEGGPGTIRLEAGDEPVDRALTGDGERPPAQPLQDPLPRGRHHRHPVGQAEAARAIGLPFAGVMGQIVLPQALRASVPPLTSVQIALLKNTTVAGALSVAEAFSIMRLLTNDHASARIEIFIVFAIIFVVLVEVVSFVGIRFERKWRVAT